MRINLKVFRIRHKLSQEEMAEKTGYTRAAYTAIEAGQREGKQEFWNRLQKSFELPDSEMWELMKDE